jgi:RNA polymerase sigma factor (sigma-70 family)
MRDPTGDPENESEILARLGKDVEDYARRKGLSKADAEDCAQTCVVRLLDALQGGMSVPGSVRDRRAWIWSILRGDALDYMRGLEAEQRHMIKLPDTGSDSVEPPAREWACDDLTPERAYGRTLFWEQVAPVLRLLPPDECLCLACRYLLEWRVQEIAKSRNENPNRVSKLLARAERHVRERLEAHEITADDLLQLLGCCLLVVTQVGSFQ